MGEAGGLGLGDEAKAFLFTPGPRITTLFPFLPLISSPVTSDELKEQLKQVKYPGFSRDIVSFGLVRSAALVDGTARVSLALTTSDPKIPLHLKHEVDKCLRALPGVKDTVIDVAVSPVKAPAAPLVMSTRTCVPVTAENLMS